MIPVYEVDATIEVEFDVLRDPTGEGIAYGVGNNSDYVPQLITTWDDARQAVDAEFQWLTQVNELSTTQAQFEELAEKFEEDDERDGSGPYLLNFLDVGVAGLVRSLAAADFAPWTSCRAHGDGRGFGTPQVGLAADRRRAEVLAELCGSNGCRLVSDGDGFLWLLAPDVLVLNRLGNQVVEKRSTFEALPVPKWRADALAIRESEF